MNVALKRVVIRVVAFWVMAPKCVSPLKKLSRGDKTRVKLFVEAVEESGSDFSAFEAIDQAG